MAQCVGECDRSSGGENAARVAAVLPIAQQRGHDVAIGVVFPGAHVAQPVHAPHAPVKAIVDVIGAVPLAVGGLHQVAVAVVLVGGRDGLRGAGPPRGLAQQTALVVGVLETISLWIGGRDQVFQRVVAVPGRGLGRCGNLHRLGHDIVQQVVGVGRGEPGIGRVAAVRARGMKIGVQVGHDVLHVSLYQVVVTIVPVERFIVQRGPRRPRLFDHLVEGVEHVFGADAEAVGDGGDVAHAVVLVLGAQVQPTAVAGDALPVAGCVVLVAGDVTLRVGKGQQLTVRIVSPVRCRRLGRSEANRDCGERDLDEVALAVVSVGGGVAPGVGDGVEQLEIGFVGIGSDQIGARCAAQAIATASGVGHEPRFQQVALRPPVRCAIVVDILGAVARRIGHTRHLAVGVVSVFRHQ